MSAAPLFDRPLLSLRRARMTPEAGFLFREVKECLTSRLDVVKRELPVILDLGGEIAPALRERQGTREVIVADFDRDEILPCAAQSFDAVTSCLHLHWFNDLPGALAQIMAALKPDGLFLAALAGGETLHELRASLMEAELEVTGGVSPRVSPFADLRDMGALLQRAGFALPVADVDRITVEYGDMFSLMRDLRGMGATNAAFSRLKVFTRRAVFMEAARIYREKFGDASGRIPATFDILHCIGWRPHDSQQQPLKPGSAKALLAEALKSGTEPV